MKYYENALRVRISHKEIYRIHQNLDYFIQEKCGVKLPYSFKILPGSADDTSVLIRTAIKLNLPGEIQRDLSLCIGDEVSFTSTITMIQRIADGKGKREVTTPPDKYESYVSKRFLRAGFELQGLLVAEPDYFYVKKSADAKPLVIPASVIRTTGIVTSVEEAEKAIVYGVGRKRVFGFGLINFDYTGNAA